MLRDAFGSGAVLLGGPAWVCLLRGWSTAAAVLTCAQWLCLLGLIASSIRRVR
jgi:hypothetical protein